MMNKSRFVSCLVMLLATTAGTAGCLTLMRGKTQNVSVTTTPPGARITLNPTPISRETTTPTVIVLERDQNYVVFLDRKGFQESSVMLESGINKLWYNIIWLHPAGWIIGAVIDVLTGAAYNLEPESIDVALQPTSIEVEPPEAGEPEPSSVGEPEDHQ